MGLPGQNEAIKELRKDIAAGEPEDLALSTLYWKAFTAGQTEFNTVMQQEKARCPLCGNPRK